MIHRAVGAADQAEGLAGVVAVQAGPGTVGLGTELGGAAPARRRAELQAPVGDKAQHIGPRSPVPRAGQREQRLVDLWPRLPAVWQARLVVGHDPHQVEGDPADVGTRRGVGQGDGANAVGGAHAQRGQEARHRAGMAVQHPPVVAEQLQAEPVSAGPGLVAGRRGRRAHLGQRRRGQHPVVAVQQEDGELAQVLRGRPELPRRGHQPGGIGRLELHDVRPRVHRETARVRLLGRQGGAGHAERAQDLLPQRVLPAMPAQLADQRAEQPVAGVGVVEQPPGRMRRRAQDVGQPRPELTGAPFPPRPRGLRGQASGVREQLGDRRARRLARVQVLAQRVGQVQAALIAQPHDQHRDKRLGQRADAELGVAVGLVPSQHAPGPEPGLAAVPDHRRGQQRRPALGLADGDPVRQRPARGRQQPRGRFRRCGHRCTLAVTSHGSTEGAAGSPRPARDHARTRG